MTEKPSVEEKPIGKVLPIEWPESDVAAFANNLMVVSDGTSAYLTFCQMCPPVLLGTPQEQQEKLDQMNNLKAHPVARIVVPIQTLRQVIEVLQLQVKRFDKKESHDAPSTP